MQPLVVDDAEEVDTTRDAFFAGRPFRLRLLRARADDDQPERRIGVLERPDREVHALDRLEPSDRQHVVAVPPCAQPRGEPGRMIQRFGREAR